MGLLPLLPVLLPVVTSAAIPAYGSARTTTTATAAILLPLFSLGTQPETKVWLLPVQAGLLRQRWWLGVCCFCIDTQEHKG